MLELIVENAQSLKQFTDNSYAQASFFFSALLKNREIKVNGKKVGEDIFLVAGDTVCYYLTKKQQEKAAFYFVYEDENILIIDKESGVNSEAVFAALSREGEYYFIHRLDRNTRGLMAFAKTREAERELFAAFKNHTLKKVYHAVCFRVPSEPQSVLTAYLKKDENKAAVKVFSKPTAGAEKIVTEYKILESAADTAKLEIVLHTGKTHQIRAHLAFIGCPIAGDMKYGDSKANKDKKLSRQLLVAKKLQFAFAGTLSYLNEKIFVSQFELTL